MDPFEVYHQLLNERTLCYEGWKSVYTGMYIYHGVHPPDISLYYLGRAVGIIHIFCYEDDPLL